MSVSAFIVGDYCTYQDILMKMLLG
jgi:hypothetical protein